MRVLLIDNYDSFSWNLVQALRVLGADVDVRRNDAIDADGARRAAPDAIVISPGPRGPADAGVSVELCRRAPAPLLGVCLGHQSLVVAMGGEVGAAARILHGKTSLVEHDGYDLFEGVPNPFPAARYHSLAATRLPDCLAPAARTADTGELMAVRHKDRPLWGVQFHPESFLTPDGPRILANFLRECGRRR